MANNVTKIEKYGLAPRVTDLLRKGVLTAVRIAEILREENPGLVISESAVGRYIASLKEGLRPEAQRILEAHVQEVLPEDLKALEEMEAKCLAWSREDAKDVVERSASAAVRIAGEIETWAAMLRDAALDEGKRGAIVKSIIKQCLLYLSRDERFQERRIQAMTMAHRVIETKLRNAGLLNEEGQGRVIIMDRSSEYDEGAQGIQGQVSFKVQ